MRLKHIVFTGSIALATFTLGCVATARPSSTRAPGLYDLNWNGGDINGVVGYFLYVNGATAVTVPDDSYSGWTARSKVLSGQLPPGLSFSNGTSVISGIPKERGHWIVTVELYDIQFLGQGYKSLQNELRFHITGSGKVND